jgi:hypothetical protein
MQSLGQILGDNRIETMKEMFIALVDDDKPEPNSKDLQQQKDPRVNEKTCTSQPSLPDDIDYSYRHLTHQLNLIEYNVKKGSKIEDVNDCAQLYRNIFKPIKEVIDYLRVTTSDISGEDQENIARLALLKQWNKRSRRTSRQEENSHRYNKNRH